LPAAEGIGAQGRLNLDVTKLAVCGIEAFPDGGKQGFVNHHDVV